ncbi:unnamed protein product [Lymnaea stagnalis]|uniref:Uncharacterized protein n=1 Tax=Lymnaea stagnalis TaxID=6523 RepID=A0AAV2GYP6_LYMST
MEPDSRGTETNDIGSNRERCGDEDSKDVRQFTLVDPEHLSKQLDKANLDDDETEELFQQALKLNAQLKKILRSRQAPAGSSPSRSGRPKKLTYPEQKMKGGTRGTSGSSALPPIESSDRKSAKVRAKSGTRSATSATPAQRATSGVSRKGSAKRKVDRPAWDDRFSYS